MRRHTGVPVAGALRQRAGDAGVEHLMPHRRHRHLDLRHVDVDALAGAPTTVERGGDGARGKTGDDRVAVGDLLRAEWRPSRIAHQPLEAGERAGARPIADHVGEGAGMPRRRHRRHDEVGPHLLQIVVAQTEARQHAGAQVLDHHVGNGDEFPYRLRPGLVAHVDRHGLLSPVQRVERHRVVGRRLAQEGEHRPLDVGPVGVLDLDHLGAEVGEHLSHQRPRQHPAELDDAHAFQRPRPCPRPLWERLREGTRRRRAGAHRTQPGEDLVVVLAERGAGARRGSVAAVVQERRAGKRRLEARRDLDALEEAALGEMLHLHHVGDGVQGHPRRAALPEDVEPLLLRPLGELGDEQRLEVLNVAVARPGVGEKLRLGPIGPAQRVLEPLPVRRLGADDAEVTVLAREVRVRRHPREPVPGAHRPLAEMVRLHDGVAHEDGDHRLYRRDVDQLALAGYVTRVERRHCRPRPVGPRQVGGLRAGQRDRLPVGRAERVGRAGCVELVHGVGPVVAIGTVEPPRRDRKQHRVRVRLAHVIPGQAKHARLVGQAVGHHHVGASDQLAEQPARPLRGNVERDAELAAVEVVVDAAVVGPALEAGRERPLGAGGVALGGLDANHLGPEVAEQPCRQGRGVPTPQVEHARPCQEVVVHAASASNAIIACVSGQASP